MFDEFKFTAIAVEQEQKAGFVYAPTVNLRALVDKGWIETYTALFGQKFIDALAEHHAEAIEWHWTSRLAFLTDKHPEYLAYFPIWSRGHMKSSVAERMIVADAILSAAYEKPGYALVVARNKDKVQEHIANVETLLSAPKVRSMCPGLSTPQRTEITNQQRRWTSSFLKTQANYAIQGGTLDSGLAGSRVEETRPTLLIFDDVDGREDSPVIAESRFRQLTTEILPMRQSNTLVFFAQNLISRYSVMYRIQMGQDRALTNRKPTQPVKAVIDLKTEQRTVDGIVKDVYVSGTPTWHVWDAQRIQDEIDTEGLSSFLREAQHEVEESKEGVILYNYDDNVHVISESEFNNVFGKNAWLHWRKKAGNDWARTKTDKHANVAAWLAVSPSDSPLPHCTFLFHPMSFPANTSPEDVAERILSCLTPYAYHSQKDGYKTWRELRQDLLHKLNASQHTKTDAERLAYEHGELSKIIPKYSKPVLQRCNVQAGDMSHEADTVRKIYTQVYGLVLRGTNPKKHGGTEDINRAMQVDYSVKHPFRDQMGYTTWFMVVPDGPDGKPKPYPLAVQTRDLEDDDLFRFQLKNCRYSPPRLTGTGEIIDEPEKMLDDAHNLLQMLYVGTPLQGSTLTVDQKVNLIISPTALEAVREAKSGTEKMSAALVLEFEKEIAEEKLGVNRWEDELI